jgi:hypothetical protein
MSLQVTVVCECLCLHVDVVVYATYFCPMLVSKSCFACKHGCLFAVWVACMCSRLSMWCGVYATAVCIEAAMSFRQPMGLTILQQTVACVIP